jgi:integrase
MSTISKALQWAHRYDSKAYPAVPEMPWTRVKKKTSVFYTDDEERRVVDYLLTVENPHYAFLVLVLVSTGVRPSELWEMLPEQVLDGWLVIGREDRLTKTNSMRFVPIRPDLEEPLRFLLTKGLPKYGTFADALQRAREACGIAARKTPYKLRHTALTRLGSAGVSLATIQELAGHSAIQTTIQYLHVEPHTVREAANVLWNRGAMVGQLAVRTPEDADCLPPAGASSIGPRNALKILRLERAVPVRPRPPAPPANRH